MSVSLSPETEQLLKEKIHAGPYRSADDLVRAALQALDLLAAQGLDETTLQSIDDAEEEILRGQVHDWQTAREQVRGFFRPN